MQLCCRMFYYRDLLKKHCKKKEMEVGDLNIGKLSSNSSVQGLLEHNNQEVPVGEVGVH